MCHAIKFYSNHYPSLRSKFKSFKVGRISSKIARFRPLFLFLQPLLIRVGPLLYLFLLHHISTYYFKCFGVCGSGHYGRGRVGKTPRGSNFGNSLTKIQVYHLLIRESD